MTDPQFQPQSQQGADPYPPQAAYQQPGYQQPGYDQQMAYQQQGWNQPGAMQGYGNPMAMQQQEEGRKAAKWSLISGIVGLFLFGIILGIVAIVQANKAERLGVPARAGKILGVLDIVLAVLVMIFGRDYYM